MRVNRYETWQKNARDSNLNVLSQRAQRMDFGIPTSTFANNLYTRAQVWTQQQHPDWTAQQIDSSVYQTLGLTQENVHIITPFVGGGFGGKTASPQAVEAAKLAKITGKPVQVAWTRAEEFFYDTFRPAAVVKIKSGLDSNGKICLWDYNVYAAGTRSSEQLYTVPNNVIRSYGQGMGGGTGAANPHPFGTGAWRAPGAPANVFHGNSA